MHVNFARNVESCARRLATLCDPRVPAAIRDLGVRLIGFRDLPGLGDTQAAVAGVGP